MPSALFTPPLNECGDAYKEQDKLNVIKVSAKRLAWVRWNSSLLTSSFTPSWPALRHHICWEVLSGAVPSIGDADVYPLIQRAFKQRRESIGRTVQPTAVSLPRNVSSWSCCSRSNRRNATQTSYDLMALKAAFTMASWQTFGHLLVFPVIVILV